MSSRLAKALYKTKRKVKGKNLFRKKVKVKTVDGQSPRYADFIANANRKDASRCSLAVATQAQLVQSKFSNCD